MRNHLVLFIILSIISGILGYLLTGNIWIAVVCFICMFIVGVVLNPRTRYMRAFYILITPLLSSLYFKLDYKSDDIHFEGGLIDMPVYGYIVLGLLCMICLILDFYERNDKKLSFKISSNKVNNNKGNNNSYNQYNG